MDSGIYVLSINDRGRVFICPVDQNDGEQMLSLQTITGKVKHQVFANIQAAFVDFLRPVYKKICGK